MSEVSRAVSKLSQIVSNLEGSVDHLEISLAGEQRDMFAAPPANSNAVRLDKASVTKKLNLAIAKIEETLEEGEQAHG